MKPIRTTSLRRRHILLASALAALPLYGADPATLLPDESVAYIESDSQAIYKLVEHPVIKTLPLKDLERLFIKMSQSTPEEQEAMKKMLETETGVSYEELEKKAGRLALSVHDLKIPENPTPETVAAEVSVAYEFDADEAFMDKYFQALVKLIGEQLEKQSGGNADIGKLVEKAKEFFEHSTVEHAGAKIHVFKLKETDETKQAPAFVREWAYAIHDKMILAGSGRDQVEEMLDRMKSGGETGSLAASAYYKNDRDKAGKTIALASLNLEVVLGLVEKFALPELNSSGVDAQKIWKVLGADKLRSAVLGLSAAAETIDVAALLTYSEKPGFFGVFVIPGPGSPPVFLPKNIQSAGYQQLDILKTLENIEKLVGEIEPEAAEGIKGGLAMAQQQTGVDIKKDLLGQLGPDIWLAAAPGKPGAGTGGARLGAAEMAWMGMTGKPVIGIRVKDSKAFGLALDTIFNKVAQKEGIFDTQDYQGFTINNVKGLPDEFKSAYVLTDEWLVLSVGAGELLEQILTRLKKPGDDGFFAQKSVSRHLDSLRGGQAATSATDVGSALSDMLGTFALLMDTIEGSGGSAPKLPLEELSKLLKVPLLSLDKGYLDDKHLEYRARIAPKGE